MLIIIIIIAGTHNRAVYVSILTAGGIPYHGIDNASVADAVCSGEIMEMQKGSREDL